MGAYTTLRCPSYCDARRRYRYIGLCYGPPGGGKMLPARYDVRSELFEAYAPQGILAIPPPVSNSPRRIEWEVAGLRLQLLAVIEAARQYQQDPWDFPGTLPNRIELLRIVTKEGAEVARESLVIGLA